MCVCVCVFAVPTEQPTFPPSQEDRLSLGDMANRKWEFTLACFSQKKPPLWRSCRAPALPLLSPPLFTAASLPPPQQLSHPWLRLQPCFQGGAGWPRGWAAAPSELLLLLQQQQLGFMAWEPGGSCQGLINTTHPVLITHKIQEEKKKKKKPLGKSVGHPL